MEDKICYWKFIQLALSYTLGHCTQRAKGWKKYHISWKIIINELLPPVELFRMQNWWHEERQIGFINVWGLEPNFIFFKVRPNWAKSTIFCTQSAWKCVLSSTNYDIVRESTTQTNFGNVRLKSGTKAVLCDGFHIGLSWTLIEIGSHIFP